jgi:hypothetical protein
VQQRELAAIAAFKLAISQCPTDDELTAWWKAHNAQIQKLSETSFQAVIGAAKARRAELNTPKQAAE